MDNEQLDLQSEAMENIDANKLSRFIEINSLHLVTEYNPVVNNSPCLQPLKSPVRKDTCLQSRDLLPQEL